MYNMMPQVARCHSRPASRNNLSIIWWFALVSLYGSSLAFSPPSPSSYYYHRHHPASSLFGISRPSWQVAIISKPTSVKLQQAASSSDSNNNNNSDETTMIATMGLNELQTLLRNAVQRQDFVEAGKLSDALFVRLYQDDPPSNEEEKRLRRRRMSWRGLGAAPWLVDRLDSLNYTFPTTIQINAMNAVNKILNATDDSSSSSSSSLFESTTLEERVEMIDKDMGLVISGTTGSGKTLAYLIPLLSTLSDSLFKRQRIRVGAEESVGDTTGDLMERVAIVTSPVVRSNTRRPMRGAGSAFATGASLSTLGTSGKDVRSPLALIVVPTRELGVQTALLLYELVGGSIKKDATEIRGKANMFQYKGPKGIRIGCVLDEEEAEFGLKLQTDVAITTPKYLKKLIADQEVNPSKLRLVIYDEADLALEQTEGSVLQALFDDNVEEREYTRLTFMVGASVTESLGNLAVRSRILPEGKSYIVTATRHEPLLADREVDSGNDETPKDGMAGDQTKVASLKDLDVCLDPGLRHERVIVAGQDESGMLTLTRLLRKELKEYETKTDNSTNAGVPAQRPRVVVFFPDEAVARKAIEPLRDALWGKHKLCVLLPETGFNPLQMMEQFKNNETTVMLATPNSVRGLDFPALSHVYTLYLPMEDPREYIHLAGRVGRVGQMGSVRGGGGRVVSILKREDAAKMDVLAKALNFEFKDVEAPAPEARVVFTPTEDEEEEEESLEMRGENGDSVDVEAMRRYLEDTMSLLSLAAEPQDDLESSAKAAMLAEENSDYDEFDEKDDSFQ
jgi:superfamily II DNA/RNA helicase